MSRGQNIISSSVGGHKVKCQIFFARGKGGWVVGCIFVKCRWPLI